MKHEKHEGMKGMGKKGGQPGFGKKEHGFSAKVGKGHKGMGKMVASPAK